MPHRLLVTVGTTSFDRLIETFAQTSVCETLHTLDISHVIYQCGRGTATNPRALKLQADGADAWDELQQASGQVKEGVIEISKDMTALMAGATLLVTHGGAGSIIEGIKHKLPILAISNPELMENHQLELCVALRDREYLISMDGIDLGVQALSEQLALLVRRGPPRREFFLDQCVASFEKAVQEVACDPFIFASEVARSH